MPSHLYIYFWHKASRNPNFADYLGGLDAGTIDVLGHNSLILHIVDNFVYTFGDVWSKHSMSLTMRQSRSSWNASLCTILKLKPQSSIKLYIFIWLLFYEMLLFELFHSAHTVCGPGIDRSEVNIWQMVHRAWCYYSAAALKPLYMVSWASE